MDKKIMFFYRGEKLHRSHSLRIKKIDSGSKITIFKSNGDRAKNI